jgi:hypothetical protein
MGAMSMKYWIRLGATITINDVEQFQKDPERYVKEALADNRVVLDGDSYIPDVDDIPEELREFGFEMSPLPITIGTSDQSKMSTFKRMVQRWSPGNRTVV